MLHKSGYILLENSRSMYGLICITGFMSQIGYNLLLQAIIERGRSVEVAKTILSEVVCSQATKASQTRAQAAPQPLPEQPQPQQQGFTQLTEDPGPCLPALVNFVLKWVQHLWTALLLRGVSISKV